MPEISRAAVINEKFKTYYDTMCFFGLSILNNGDDTYPHEFYESFADFLCDVHFPCNKLILNPFYGYDHEFSIVAKYDKAEICRYVLSVDKYGLFKVNAAYYAKGFETIKEIFNDKVIIPYFDRLNQDRLKEEIDGCGLSLEGENKVYIDRYDDGKISHKDMPLCGTLADIFSSFTSLNDTYKYCYGTYYKFADSKVESIYRMFTQCNGGSNYFILNAVKDGKLID